jgi:hypothetical protein
VDCCYSTAFQFSDLISRQCNLSRSDTVGSWILSEDVSWVGTDHAALLEEVQAMGATAIALPQFTVSLRSS